MSALKMAKQVVAIALLVLLCGFSKAEAIVPLRRELYDERQRKDRDRSHNNLVEKQHERAKRIKAKIQDPSYAVNDEDCAEILDIRKCLCELGVTDAQTRSLLAEICYLAAELLFDKGTIAALEQAAKLLEQAVPICHTLGLDELMYGCWYKLGNVYSTLCILSPDKNGKITSTTKRVRHLERAKSAWKQAAQGSRHSNEKVRRIARQARHRLKRVGAK